MTNKREEQNEERDELKLDAETVKDLEVEEESADEVRGGGRSASFAVGGGP